MQEVDVSAVTELFGVLLSLTQQSKGRADILDIDLPDEPVVASEHVEYWILLVLQLFALHEIQQQLDHFGPALHFSLSSYLPAANPEELVIFLDLLLVALLFLLQGREKLLVLDNGIHFDFGFVERHNHGADFIVGMGDSLLLEHLETSLTFLTEKIGAELAFDVEEHSGR